MWNLMKKIIIIAGLVWVLILVLVWGGFSFLETSSARKILLTHLNQRIPGQVFYEKLGISIFAGQVEIQGLQIEGPAKDQKGKALASKDLMQKEPNFKTLVRSDKLGMALSWKALLNGEIHLTSVRMTSPDLDLEIGEDGSLNLVSAFVPPGPSPPEPSRDSLLPFNILVDELAITNGAIGFKMADNDLEFSGVDILISKFDLFKESARLTTGFKAGNLTTQGQFIEFEPFHAQAVLEAGGVSGILVQAGTRGLALEIKGHIRDVFTVPFMELSLGTRMELEKAAVLIPGLEDLAPQGEVALDLSVKGKTDNPEVQVTVQSPKAGFKDQVIQDVMVSCAMKDRRVTVMPSRVSSDFGHLSLEGEIDLAKAFSQEFQGKFDLNQISYDLKAGLDQTPASALMGKGSHGLFTTGMKVSGQGIDPETIKADITAEVIARGFRAPGMAEPVDANIQADAGLEASSAQFRSIRLTTPGMDLTGHGRVDIPAGEISAQLDLTLDDLGVLDWLTRVKGEGNIRATAFIEGPVSLPRVVLSAAGSDVGINGIFLGNLDLKSVLDRNGRIDLDRVSLENQGSSVQAQGWIDLLGKAVETDPKIPVDLAFTLDNLEMKDFMPELALAGKFNGQFMVKGSLVDPIVSAELEGSELLFDKTRIGDARAKMELARGVLEIESFQLTNQKSSIFFSGKTHLLDEKFALKPDPEFQLVLDQGKVFLEDFLDKTTGSISFGGHISGNLDNLDGVLDFNSGSLDLGGQKIDGFSAKAHLKGQTIEITQMDIQVAEGSKITAQGRVIPRDKTFDLQAVSRDFDLTRLNLVKENKVDKGLLTFDLAARGSFEDPEVTATLGIRDLMVLKKKQDPIDLKVELKNRRVGIKGSLGPAFDGEYHLDTRVFSAALDMEGYDLTPWFKLAGQSEFAGQISGRIKASGHMDHLDQVSASADFSQIKIDFADQPFAQVNEMDLSLEKGRIHLLPAQILLLEQAIFMVKGQGDLGGDLDFDAQGNVPLALVNPFIKEAGSARGNIKTHATLKGNAKAPQVFADLEFNDLAMAMEGLAEDIKEVQGQITLTPDRIEIVRLKGVLGEGGFDLEGGVVLNQWKPETFELLLNAQQIAVDIPDLMDLTLNGNLKLAGTEQASDLTGNLVLLTGRYYRDVELDLVSAATRQTRKITPLEEGEAAPFLKTMDLNVQISRREPLLVENNLAELEVSPDLTLQGTAAAPLLTGRAQVDSGILRFQKKEFEVKKGVIDFLNPYKIEPTLDIEGEVDIRTWTITLTVSGTPDNLDFKFSSNPSEQHADIVSLIAFGKTTRELQAADGGATFNPENILAGMVADSLEQNVKDTIGLDQMEIKVDEDDSSGATGVNVTLGKDLSRQLSIKYGVDISGGKRVQRVTSQYKILENFLMSGYQDTGGNFGGELKYRLEFR